MATLLTLATLLGGAAALWFFWDKIVAWLFPQASEAKARNLLLVATLHTAGTAYDVSLRLSNPIGPSGVGILTSLFCRVHAARRHPSTEHKNVVGAAIHAKKLPTLYLRPTLADQRLKIQGERRFPYGEVEDFSFKLVLTQGWQYLVSFGARWHDVLSQEPRETLTPVWLVGEAGDPAYEGVPPPDSDEVYSSMANPNLDEPLSLDTPNWPEASARASKEPREHQRLPGLKSRK